MKRKFHCYPSWNITWKHSFSVAQHSSCKREHPERICNYVYRKLFLWKFCRYNLVISLQIIFNKRSIIWFFRSPIAVLIFEYLNYLFILRWPLLFFLFKTKTVSFERRLKNKEKLKLQKKVKMKEVTKRITT